MRDGFIHRTVGLRDTEEEMDLDYCRESVNTKVKYALSDSLGFGGHNACLVASEFEE